MTSELHAWCAATTHVFTGTMNDQATEAELIAADTEMLLGMARELESQFPAATTKMTHVVTDGKWTHLLVGPAGQQQRFLSFVR
jgi:hypothetical protein